MSTKPQTPAATKPAKEKKPAVPLAQRLNDQLKRGALGGKLTAEELDKLAALCGALKTFIAA